MSHLYPRPHSRLYGIAIHQLVRAMSTLGCQPHVVSPIPIVPAGMHLLKPKWADHWHMPREDCIEGIRCLFPRYVEFPKGLCRPSSGIRMYRGIRRTVGSLARQASFDIIHAHMAVPDGHAGLLLSRDYGVPLVVTVRGTDVAARAKRSSKYTSILKNILATANQVITPSPRLQRELVHNMETSSTVIPNGVAESLIASDVHGNALRTKLGGSPIVLSASRLVSIKGIDLNLQALQRLITKHPYIRYLIVGDGPERGRLERLARQLGLTKHVDFLGHLGHGEVMEYMAACDVFALPSWQETFGLVYIEAMAHGKPVVGVRGQGIDGIVVHGETGMLAEPHDVDSLAAALDVLLSNPEAARAMGERARQLVLQNYIWDKSAQATIQVYRGVLDAC